MFSCPRQHIRDILSLIANLEIFFYGITLTHTAVYEK